MQLTFYTIYKTTNLINGKIYIGKHVTADLNDGYLGSGKYLKHAISKYGVENFSKEILHVFDNETDMNAREAALVTEAFVLQENNYNLCIGGQGGFSYINREVITDELRSRRAKLGRQAADQNTLEKYGSLDKIRKAWNKAGSDTIRERCRVDPEFKQQRVEMMNHARKFCQTPEAKQRRKETNDSRKWAVGSNNSQFGTCWVTNGIENKKILKHETLPEGWKYGRVIKKS